MGKTLLLKVKNLDSIFHIQRYLKEMPVCVQKENT